MADLGEAGGHDVGFEGVDWDDGNVVLLAEVHGKIEAYIEPSYLAGSDGHRYGLEVLDVCPFHCFLHSQR